MTTPTISTTRLASRASELKGSVIDASTALLASQTHDIVRFAMGAPNDELIPTEDFGRILGTAAEGRFGYGASEGEADLVDQIVRYQASRGIETSPERIVVTTGGMQGLDIAFKMLVDPGDGVIVECPTYTNGIGTALSYQASVIEAPMDENGLVVEALPDLVENFGKTPKAIYTIPNFQNPSGTTMSRERRELLLELAEKWDAYIVDDDPYGALRFEGDEVPGFLELSPGNPRVIQVRTFSKTLAPGLRVGWMELDPSLRDIAVNAKPAMDTCTSVPMQKVVSDYLAEGKLDEHIDWLRSIYRERKEAMTQALAERFGDDILSTDPDGGFFLWIDLQGKYSGIDTEELFPLALRHGVAYIPGPAFTDSGSQRHSLRLCFATSSPERIREGVERLGTALDEFAEQQRGTL